MKGAEYIAEFFYRRDLKRVFTFPGGTIAPLFDALARKGIEITCARHEQGAGYMALAIARLTQSPQVVMVTSGPGATNLVTVVADAYFDSTPLVVITGQVGTGDLNSGRKVRQCGFQQVDTVAIMKPIAKAVFQPKNPDELPSILEQAFFISLEGRPGPVVIDLPMDVQNSFLDPPRFPEWKSESPLPAIEPKVLSVIAAKIAGAERPMILAGQGVLLSGAVLELRRLAEECGIPVVTSLLGLGVVATNLSLSLGFIGHTGNQAASLAVHNADLLLVVGARLDVRQTGTCVDKFVPKGEVVRIDLDKAELEYSRVRSMNILADAKTALNGILNEIKKRPKKDLSYWHDQIAGWQKAFPLSYASHPGELKPQQVIETVNRLTTGRKLVVTSGVGSHQQWTARHFDFDYPARVFLTSGGHGAMGYDLPSAIGAQVARPDQPVICFVGDGSFQINIQELQTAVELKTRIKIFVLDNKRLALVSQFQMLNWASDPTTGNKLNPDFAAIARAYGIQAFTVDKHEKLETVAAQALAADGPALVHCLVSPGEDVMPMLLAGQTMDKMWPYDRQ